MNQKSSDKNDNPFPEFSGELNLPENIDRRTFLIRNAVIGAAAAITGTVWTSEARAQQAAKEKAEREARKAKREERRAAASAAATAASSPSPSP